MNFPNQVNNFSIYAGNDLYLGIANVELPEINNMVDALKGGGQSGNLEIPVIGHVTDMACTLNFHALVVGATTFLKQEVIDLTARGIIQEQDNVTRVFIKRKWRFFMKTAPKALKPGKLDVGVKGDMVVTRSVQAYTAWVGTSKQWEIDPAAMKFEVAGVDYLAEDRGWL